MHGIHGAGALAAVLGLVLGAAFPGDSGAPRNGDASVNFSARETGKVDFATAWSSANNAGTLVIGGIPAGAVVRRAFLYTYAIRNTPETALTLNGVPLTVNLIGTAGGIPNIERVYRNEVTSIVAGNGTYSWTVTAGIPTQSRGAALLVIYENPALPADYDIEIHDGAHPGTRTDGAEASWPNPTTFTGFVVGGGPPPEAKIGFLAYLGSGNRFFNGIALGPPGGYPVTPFQLWRVFDVSSLVSAGATTATANCNENCCTIMWQCAVLRVRIDPIITDHTPPEIAVISPAGGAVVASSPQTVRVCVRDESATAIASVPPLVWSPSSLPAATAGESSASFPLAEGPNTLTVTATDAFGQSSPASVTIVLDTVVPDVAITAPADGSVVATAGAVLSATVNDATATLVTSSPEGIAAGLPPGGGAVSGTVALVEGPNTLAVTAVDAAGHAGGTSITVIRDTIPPAITVLSPAGGTVFGDDPVPFSIGVGDATATTVTFGGNTVPLPAGGGTADGGVDLVEGPNDILVTATDAAGNSSGTTVRVVLDLTAPIVTIDSPAAGTILGPGGSPAVVIATVDDLTATTVGSEPAGVSGTLPAGGGIATGSVALAEGSNTVTVSATDEASGTGSGSVVVILDTTPPLVAVDSPADPSAVRGTIDFHAQASDILPGSGVDRVEFLVDGGLVATLPAFPYEALFDTAGLPDGQHTFAARAVDGMGNAAVASVTVRVDNTPPAVAIDAPAAGAVVGGTIPLVVSASDGGAGLVALGMAAGGAAPTGDASAAYAPPVASDTRTGQEDTTRHPDGPLAITATARDAAGNEASVTITVVVDNTAPEKCLVAPTAGQVVSGVLEARAEASDPNLESLEIRVDGVPRGTSPVSPFVIAVDTRLRLDGSMTVTAIARDLAGNTSTCTVTVTVDNVAFCLHPETLNLKSKGGDHSITVCLEGPNLALLMPTEAHGLQLRVPGGNPVPSTAGFAGDDVVGDGDTDGIPDLTVKFDRQALIASIRAGIAAGMIPAAGPVPVTLVAEGTFVIGTKSQRIVGG